MQVSTDYDTGVFVDGSDTENVILFKSSIFSFINNTLKFILIYTLLESFWPNVKYF
ncbi:MAG: hypothetical protein P8X73_10965 [Ignavibacteriaceae bacterium]